VNKMDASNLATVFGPNILKPKIDTMEKLLLDSANVARVVTSLIRHHNKIFSEVNSNDNNIATPSNEINSNINNNNNDSNHNNDNSKDTAARSSNSNDNAQLSNTDENDIEQIILPDSLQLSKATAATNIQQLTSSVSDTADSKRYSISINSDTASL